MHKGFQIAFYALLICTQAIAGGLFNKESSTDSVERLQKELHEVLAKVDPEAQIGVHVVEVSSGKTLFEKSIRQRFIPGAAVKLMTAGAALHVLGPGFCFETTLLTDGKIVDGVLRGNLYLAGSGDPSLVSHSLEDLIFQLKLHNIREIEGDLVFDASEFDSLSLAPGWMWDEKPEYRDGPVDALTINHSCIKIWVKPAHQKAISPFVHIEPELPGLIIENNAKMIEGEPKWDAIVVGKKEVDDKDVLFIEGDMSLKSRILEFSVPVRQPSLYVATEFSVLLKKHQMKHQGKMRFDTTPSKACVLANHVSESLFHLVMHMLKNNDDLYANCFFKKIGRIKYNKPGTWPNGSQAVRDFLNSIGYKDRDDIVLLDGSGESRCNIMTPQAMTSFLCKMYRQFSPEFIASIPVVGVDSTFKKRLKDKCLSGRIRVLPGTLQGVSSLCGYVTTADKETIALSIMINASQSFAKEAKVAIEDKICAALVKFSMQN